jgi:hypothetical protein
LARNGEVMVRIRVRISPGQEATRIPDLGSRLGLGLGLA